MKPAQRKLAFTFLFLGLTPLVSAQTLFWNPSPLDDNWANTVWSSSSGGAPTLGWTSGNNAVFDQIGTYTATINADQTATNIEIKAGAVTFSGTHTAISNALIIDSGASLTADSDRFLKVGTTTLTVNGTLTQTAAVSANTRRVSIAGGNGSIVLSGGFRTSGNFNFAGNISGTGSIITDAGGTFSFCQASVPGGTSPEADGPVRAHAPLLRSILEDSVSGGHLDVGRRVAVTSAQRAGATMTSTSPTPTSTPRGTSSRAVLAVVLAVLVVLAVVFWLFARQGGPAQPDGDGRLEIVMDGYEFEPADITLPTEVPLELVFVNRDDTVHHVSFGRNVMVDDGAEVGFAEDLLAGTNARIEPSRARVGPSEQFPTLSVQVEPDSRATLYVTLPEGRDGDWMVGCFTARGCQFRAGLAGTITVE